MNVYRDTRGGVKTLLESKSTEIQAISAKKEITS